LHVYLLIIFLVLSISSSGSMTLGYSIPSTSQRSNSTAPPAPYTYNLDRFRQQDAYDDGAIHGRTTDQAYPSRDNIRVFYKARGTSALSTFNAAFHGTAPHGVGSDG
jgi:hypothetical protein